MNDEMRCDRYEEFLEKVKASLSECGEMMLTSTPSEKFNPFMKYLGSPCAEVPLDGAPLEHIGLDHRDQREAWRRAKAAAIAAGEVSFQGLPPSDLVWGEAPQKSIGEIEAGRGRPAPGGKALFADARWDIMARAKEVFERWLSTRHIPGDYITVPKWEEAYSPPPAGGGGEAPTFRVGDRLRTLKQQDYPRLNLVVEAGREIIAVEVTESQVKFEDPGMSVGLWLWVDHEDVALIERGEAPDGLRCSCIMEQEQADEIYVNDYIEPIPGVVVPDDFEDRLRLLSEGLGIPFDELDKAAAPLSIRVESIRIFGCDGPVDVDEVVDATDGRVFQRVSLDAGLPKKCVCPDSNFRFVGGDFVGCTCGAGG